MNEVFGEALLAALRGLGFDCSWAGASRIRVGRVHYEWYSSARSVYFQRRRYIVMGRGNSRTMDISQALADVCRTMPGKIADAERADKRALYREQAEAMQPRPQCTFGSDTEGVWVTIRSDNITIQAMLDILQEEGFLPQA